MAVKKESTQRGKIAGGYGRPSLPARYRSRYCAGYAALSPRRRPHRVRACLKPRGDFGERDEMHVAALRSLTQKPLNRSEVFDVLGVVGENDGHLTDAARACATADGGEHL